MLLRGMHDRGCDDIYVIVTDLKRNEMDQVTEYFKYVCQNTAGGHCKPSVEQKINHDCKCRSFHMGTSPLPSPGRGEPTTSTILRGIPCSMSRMEGFEDWTTVNPLASVG